MYQILTKLLKDLNRRLSRISSSVESQKDAKNIQSCSVEIQERALSLYKVYGDSALPVLSGTSLNNDSALLALNCRFILKHYTLLAISLFPDVNHVPPYCFTTTSFFYIVIIVSFLEMNNIIPRSIQGDPKRMQRLWSLISRTSSIKRNWFLFYYVETYH